MNKTEFIKRYGYEAYQKRLAAHRKCYKSHRAQRAESNRKWFKEHPGYRKERYRIYNKNLNRSKPYMNRYKLAHPQCQCCFNPTEDIHHIIPLPNDRLLDFGDPILMDDNLMALCKNCHGKIHVEMNNNK